MFYCFMCFVTAQFTLSLWWGMHLRRLRLEEERRETLMREARWAALREGRPIEPLFSRFPQRFS